MCLCITHSILHNGDYFSNKNGNREICLWSLSIADSTAPLISSSTSKAHPLQEAPQHSPAVPVLWGFLSHCSG
jgi:hypothetical protein